MADEPDSTSGIGDQGKLTRRRVLGAATAATTGLAGLSGSAGASGTETSFFGECSSGWESAPDDYPVVDLRTDEPTIKGDFPWGDDEFVLYVHGWLEKFASGARDQGYTLETALRQNGYEQPTAAVVWNSNQPVWPLAQRRADEAGRRLAEVLDDYLEACPGTTIRTVDHSLGSRVILEALATLDGDQVLENVSLVGGAVNPDSVCEGTRYAAGIANSASEVYNYHSRNDDIVCDIYALSEGTSGIGCVGSECDDVPDDFSDVDVTDSVDAHCNYGKPDVGCVPQIVSNF